MSRQVSVLNSNHYLASMRIKCFFLLKGILLLALYLQASSFLSAQEISYPDWTHFYIDAALPGASWGTGGIVFTDLDGDGDLDVAISRRDMTSAYWYERMSDSVWTQHLMGSGQSLDNTLGMTAIDMDQDGWVDVMCKGIWFRNPGCLAEKPDTPWEAHLIDAGGHDEATVDIDGNGVDDLLVYDGSKLAWYNTSDSLRETVISSGHRDHGGTTPHGFGYINRDRHIDVIIPGIWFANPGKSSEGWKANVWPFKPKPKASYGRSIRSWIVDIDGDGKNDIVYSHCDTGGSDVYWVKNKGKGKKWEPYKLADPPTASGDVEGTGSFHSLGVADFNQDGHLDIFAGEQEDPDTYMERDGLKAMKPRGLKERGVIWYSDGGKTPNFEPYVIHIDNPGWHDAQLGDVDGDGDMDIITKIWHSDGGDYHLDLWRNELIYRQ